MMIDVGNRNYSFDSNPLRFVNCVELERNETLIRFTLLIERHVLDGDVVSDAKCMFLFCFETRLIDCIRWDFLLCLRLASP